MVKNNGYKILTILVLFLFVGISFGMMNVTILSSKSYAVIDAAGGGGGR
ncbi:MAG: hypothetical protein IJ215_01700 [Clostridia bacterium]|nr:hypothetical protein [Clostridia bacterium]